MSEGQRVRPGCVFRNTGVMGHRWVVVAIAEEGKMLLANWTSLRPNQKATCVLHPGEHPGITHDSYILFAKAQEYSYEQLAELIREGNLVSDGQLNEQTLCRIQQALFIDRYTPDFLKRHYAFLKRA